MEEKIKKMDEENDFANMISLLGAVGAQQVSAAAPATASAISSSQQVSAALSRTLVSFPPPKPKLSARDFSEIHFNDYLLVMNFNHGSQNIGTVVEKPSPHFYRPVIKSLARFCQSKVAFDGRIAK